ncbi:Undifferentiated embryonic cell transcription factor 1 [Cricetulus griseus]|uniref:Undifferentiated embryonic cell transcription factor 1 n=1 Tax=Cricetulus griseus TaxID=10029 RepID=G3IEA4_CRIGR|nr:Undifferentiated embryonic cell transcription factor 1 [Cricetulus griseus]
MLLLSQRLPQFSPLSLSSPDAQLRPSEDVQVTASDAFAPTPGAMAEPGLPKAPVSPGSAQGTPCSAREMELLLGTLLQAIMWCSLLLDHRQALPTYRHVSAALARQQVRRMPAQCRRHYKFFKDKLRDSHGQPSRPYDDQIRQLMGRRWAPASPQSLYGPWTSPAPRPHDPGGVKACPYISRARGYAATDCRGRRPRLRAQIQFLYFKSADAHRITSSSTPRALGTLAPESGRAALGSSPPPTLEYDTEDPNEPPNLPQDPAPPAGCGSR